MIARFGKTVRWTVRLLLLFLVLDLFYLAATWPEWHLLASGAVPKSAFMREYEQEKGRERRISWQPVALSAIPQHMRRAVVLSEDSRFHEHSGFDLIAFKEAMDLNLSEGRLAAGASTISQQTVKNLFLSSAKTPLRKWHELILTWGMERRLSKDRIMELYLNIAEFGPGVYGVQAAARHYWGLPVSQIDVRQAAELAATLPSPTHNNPATRTPAFEKRAARVMRLLRRYPGNAAEAVSSYWRAAGDADVGDSAAEADAAECRGDDCPTGIPESLPEPVPGTTPAPTAEQPGVLSTTDTQGVECSSDCAEEPLPPAPAEPAPPANAALDARG